MDKTVERSITLWKAQHGPFRENVGKHLQGSSEDHAAFNVQPEHEDYIDYTDRACEWH